MVPEVAAGGGGEARGESVEVYDAKKAVMVLMRKCFPSPPFAVKEEGAYRARWGTRVAAFHAAFSVAATSYSGIFCN